jgi:hypothetical protein
MKEHNGLTRGRKVYAPSKIRTRDHINRALENYKLVIRNKKITGHHRKKSLRVQMGFTSLLVMWEEL